ncbi:MAG: hypothetical protein MUF76_10210 [Hydrogenophaga sp.]|nr:hypothetical protein [Hydrogenophaga sp.]
MANYFLFMDILRLEIWEPCSTRAAAFQIANERRVSRGMAVVCPAPPTVFAHVQQRTFPVSRDNRHMQKQRVFVSVVGFSDVERHALNTVFRLSEERDLSYAPWVASNDPDTAPRTDRAQVLLVDGSSAEAVLSHARQMPEGQWLIWVGPDAPEHAWRVLERPIQWSHILHDLDAVFAARQADSGLLDLDITAPGLLHGEAGAGDSPARRALLVGMNERESALLRARFLMAGVGEVDEAHTTNAAIDLMGRHSYVCGAFNLDDDQVDPWTLMSVFRKRNPKSVPAAVTELAGPLAGWWSRRRMRRNAEKFGVTALLARPLNLDEVAQLMNRL